MTDRATEPLLCASRKRQSIPGADPLRDGMKKRRRWRLILNGTVVQTERISGELSVWADDFRLALGNELTEDRSWLGELHRVAVYARALDAEKSPGRPKRVVRRGRPDPCGPSSGTPFRRRAATSCRESEFAKCEPGSEFA